MERIGILTGGDSAEDHISLLSAKTVLKHLDKTKYNGTIIYLKNDEYKVENQTINLSDFSYVSGNTKIKFDKLFIALHGPPAENGLIQDYFDKISLPYTSCNAKVSALTFNKFKCNKALKKLGFLCADSIAISSNKLFSENDIIRKIELPCFVKPNSAGSSYGISKVTKETDLAKAIRKASLHDTKVIIERFINGKEISCGVYCDGDKINTLPITEIITENDFFDYEAKYKGKSQEITPAKISNQLTAEIQKITANIYRKMNLSGICRIDFIIESNKPYILEINTIPGLSEKSIIPKQLKAANISLLEIFDLCLSNIN